MLSRADNIPAEKSISTITVTNPDNPFILPEFDVNDTEQRLKKREEIRKKKRYPYMCLRNASLIESIVFSFDYSKSHPTERVRLLLCKPKLNFDSKPTNLIYAFVVYTHNGQLWYHDCTMGDSAFSFFNANDISKTSDKEFFIERTKEARKLFLGAGDPGQDPFPDISIIYSDEMRAKIPNNLPGDDSDLQVYYARQRLSDLGLPVKIVKTSARVRALVNPYMPNDATIFLEFVFNNQRYTYNPVFGCFLIYNKKTLSSGK